MPVNTPGDSYAEMAPKWERCRDAYDGGDAIKAKNDKYLPPLDSHRKEPSYGGIGAGYHAYKHRAVWYGATARSVDGLAGAIFQKPPKIRAPEVVEAHLSDVTLTNQSAEMFALDAAKEVLKTGRLGVLVDWSASPASGSGPRPYWRSYRAEDIYSYRIEVFAGDEVLTRVVLREVVDVEDPDDLFKAEPEERFRVLELVPNGETRVYIQTVWRKTKTGFAAGDSIAPDRRKVTLSRIPFVFLGPDSTSPHIDKPPLLDLVDVNISHYMTSADLEHGRHFTALPTPWVAGAQDLGEKLFLGSKTAWVLPQGAQAGMLEFTGQGLGALERADEDKRHKMAVLGARMLEQQQSKSNTNESATAAGMRHAGEQATLKTLAQALEAGLMQALSWHTWWFTTATSPEESGAVFELNKDFTVLRMPPEQLRALTEALQANGMLYETYYENLEEGGLTRPGVTAEEEKRELDKRKPAPPPAVAPPVMDDGGGEGLPGQGTA